MIGSDDDASTSSTGFPLSTFTSSSLFSQDDWREHHTAKEGAKAVTASAEEEAAEAV